VRRQSFEIRARGRTVEALRNTHDGRMAHALGSRDRGA
jgi:hypothetical protein